MCLLVHWIAFYVVSLSCFLQLCVIIAHKYFQIERQLARNICRQLQWAALSIRWSRRLVCVCVCVCVYVRMVGGKKPQSQGWLRKQNALKHTPGRTQRHKTTTLQDMLHERQHITHIIMMKMMMTMLGLHTDNYTVDTEPVRVPYVSMAWGTFAFTWPVFVVVALKS